MKNIGFIGAFDKTDLILYIAKIITMTGKKVLVIDSTINQKARYIVPVISPTKSYITEFEDIDVAVGFESYEEINKYLNLVDPKPTEYDIVLADIDCVKNFEAFNNEETVKNYFITSFDLFSLKKGLEILGEIREPVKLTKVLFSKEMLKEEDEYLDYLSLGYKIIWEDYKILFPFDTEDQNVIIENQRVSKVKLRKLSELYKSSLMYIVQEILPDTKESDIKRAFRSIEKEV